MIISGTGEFEGVAEAIRRGVLPFDTTAFARPRGFTLPPCLKSVSVPLSESSLEAVGVTVARRFVEGFLAELGVPIVGLLIRGGEGDFED